VKRIALALGLCILLAGCAPRAREYPAAATGQATPPPTAGGASVTLDDPPVRFAVPEGWFESADTNKTVCTLKNPEGDLTIEFYALPRIHPDRTQKQELSALKNTVRRLYSDVKFDYDDPAWMVSGGQGKRAHGADLCRRVRIRFHADRPGRRVRSRGARAERRPAVAGDRVKEK